MKNGKHSVFNISARAAMTLLFLLVTTTTTMWADDTYTSYTVTAGIGNTYGDNSNPYWKTIKY